MQVYESVMVDGQGTPTTGLLRGVRYAKDNRLLPRGFNKETASADVAIHGGAVADADFGAGGDRVRYVLTLPDLQLPLTIQAELRIETIGYRWAQNLGAYDAAETEKVPDLLRSDGERIVDCDRSGLGDR